MFVLKCLWLILPGVFANAFPLFTKNLKFLAYPIDFGRTFFGKPIFGPNKTFRGFFFGILAAIVIVYLQTFLYKISFVFRQISFIPYDQYNFALLGFLVGFGALFGDLVKSFIKRRLGIKPGARFFPWDQLDAFIGALIFISIVWIPPWQAIVFLTFFVPFLHISTNFLWYWLGLKKTKW